MRCLVVFILVFALSHSLQAQSNEGGGDTVPQAESQPELPTPIEIIILDDLRTQDPSTEHKEHDAEKRAQADLIAQQGMLEATIELNKLTEQQVGIAWFETAVTLASVVFAATALAISRQANSYAKTSTRAWLKIVPIVRPFREAGISFEITMENVGTAPATDIEVECQEGYTEIGTSVFFKDGVLYDPKGMVVFPGDKGAGCGSKTMRIESYESQVAQGRVPAFYVQLRYKSGRQKQWKSTEAVVSVGKFPTQKSVTFVPAFTAGTYIVT